MPFDYGQTDEVAETVKEAVIRTDNFPLSKFLKLILEYIFQLCRHSSAQLVMAKECWVRQCQLVFELFLDTRFVIHFQREDGMGVILIIHTIQRFPMPSRNNVLRTVWNFDIGSRDKDICEWSLKLIFSVVD